MDVLVAYGACKKNQNCSSPTPILDGCMEFSSSSFKGDRKCEACGCHRSFHERIILMRDQKGTISCASQMVLPDLGSNFQLHQQKLKSDGQHLQQTTHQDQPQQQQQPQHPQVHHHQVQFQDLGSYFTNVSCSGANAKRRRLDRDELPGEDAYSDFIAGRASSAIVSAAAAQDQPVPLQVVEVDHHRKAGYSSSTTTTTTTTTSYLEGGGGWICEADKEKLPGFKRKERSLGLSSSQAVPPEKLASFFERLQKEHPESPLKLEFVDGSWRVLCGVCARYLRADKKGETLHNIQKQHFSTPKHMSNLQAKMEAPDEMEFWLKRMAKLREKRAQHHRAEQQQHPKFITAG